MPTTDRHDLEDRSTLERIRRIVAGMRRYGDLSHTIGALADLGVDRFHMHVSDGSTRFHGTRFFQLYGPALHARVSISEVTDHDLVERAYRLFQEGVTDLRTFLGHGADAGVDMLVVHVQDRMFVLLDQHGRILGIHPIGVPAERLNRSAIHGSTFVSVRPFLLFLIGLCTAGASAQTTPGAAWRHLLPAPADRIREVDLLHFDPPPLGLFCKFDVQLEDLLPVPVRFRLGDPLQVDRMEGKGPLSYDTRPPREAEQRR